MQLTAENDIGYLRDRGFLPANEIAVARELGGGVSNVVVHISRPNHDDLVLKQARKRLKVADPWFCSIERIWREVDVLRECDRLLRRCATSAPIHGEVPHFLFDDRDNYLYAMSAAPLGQAGASVASHGCAAPTFGRDCRTQWRCTCRRKSAPPASDSVFGISVRVYFPLR